MSRAIKFLMLACLLFVVSPLTQAQEQPAETSPLDASQKELVAQARKIIENWRAQGEGDVSGERPLIVTLFTGNDTDPAPHYRERLTRTMAHIQAFYAHEMQRHGFDPLSFRLEKEEDGLLKIHVVRGDRATAAYNGDHGGEIRNIVNKQLAAEGIDGAKQTVVIFCNLTVWNPETRTMRHHSPYYASGSSRSGTAWQLDSILLDSAELGNVQPDLFIRDGQYGRISLGRYQSIFVGGICHELGHAFGLPHNKERADERELWGTALMGSGNRTYGEELRDEGKGSFLTLAHAMKLAVHPGFSGSVKEMDRRPRGRYTDLTLEPIQDGRGVRLIGQLESDIPVHAVLAYLDPEGGSDYDATTHVAVPDAQGRFTIDCTAFAGKEGRVRLVRVHANGWADFREDLGMPYTRDGEGKLTIQRPERLGQFTEPQPSDAVYATAPVEACPHCKGN